MINTLSVNVNTHTHTHTHFVDPKICHKTVRYETSHNSTIHICNNTHTSLDQFTKHNTYNAISNILNKKFINMNQKDTIYSYKLYTWESFLVCI